MLANTSYFDEIHRDRADQQCAHDYLAELAEQEVTDVTRLREALEAVSLLAANIRAKHSEHSAEHKAASLAYDGLCDLVSDVRSCEH